MGQLKEGKDRNVEAESEVISRRSPSKCSEHRLPNAAANVTKDPFLTDFAVHVGSTYGIRCLCLDAFGLAADCLPDWDILLEKCSPRLYRCMVSRFLEAV
eukprot:3405235-Amphidinium_carterae.1